MTTMVRAAVRRELAGHFAACGWDPVATARRLGLKKVSLYVRAHRLEVFWASARRVTRLGLPAADAMAVALAITDRAVCPAQPDTVWMLIKVAGVYRVIGVREEGWQTASAKERSLIGMYRERATAEAALTALRYPRAMQRGG